MEEKKIRKDFHIHSRFSTDSKAEPEAICQAAVARGLTEICFTDHQDLGFEDPNYFRFDPKAYFKALEALKGVWAGRLQIHIGMELGLIPDDPQIARQAQDLVKDYPWDFIIGSTHQIPLGQGGPYVDPANPAAAPQIWAHFRSVQELVGVYYETVRKNIEQFDLCHCIGHIDYISRYVPRISRSAPMEQLPYRFEDHREQIDQILEAAVGKGIAIEVNTGGLCKGTGQTNPEDRIVRRYLALGGKKLTYGSDAHRPEHVGFGFETLPDYGPAVSGK